MTLKSDKLTKRLQTIHQFITEQTPLDKTYVSVAQDLVKITESLKERKLLIQLISADLISAQTLQTLLKNSQIISDIYQFQISSLPSKPKPEKPKSNLSAVLVCQNASNQNTESIKLSIKCKNVIGRNPHICDLLIPNSCYSVSGHHAEIQYEKSSWQFCDLSRHGSYINRQKIYKECRLLKSGDQITLGEEKLSKTSAEFIFEERLEEESEDEGFVQEPVNCDLLFIIINPNLILTDDEQWFLKKVAQAKISQVAIIIEISQPDLEVAKQIEEKATELKIYLQDQYPTLSCEVVTAILQSFSSQAEATEIELTYQEKLDKFIKSLETIIKRRPEDILIQRLDTQVSYQITQIVKELESKNTNIRKNIVQAEDELKSIDKDAIKESLKKAMKQISEEQDLFFKQVKDEINKSKSDLLNELLQNSLLVKIQSFVNSLNLSVIYKEGYCFVTLQRNFEQIQQDSHNNYDPDVHRVLVDLIQTELNFWQLEEWDKVANSYGKGGFDTLLQRTSKILQPFSFLSLSSFLLNTVQNPEVKPPSTEIFLSASLEDKCKQPTLIGYMIHKLRNMTLSTVAVIVLLLGGISTALSPFDNTFQSSNNQDKTTQNRGLKNFISQSKPVIWLVVAGIAIPVILRDFRRDKKIRIEDITQKLQMEVSKYYQAITKNLLDKMAQSIFSTLETEARCFTKNLEVIEEQSIAYLEQLEKKQQVIKSQIIQYNQQQRTLETDLQKLKRI